MKRDIVDRFERARMLRLAPLVLLAALFAVACGDDTGSSSPAVSVIDSPVVTNSSVVTNSPVVTDSPAAADSPIVTDSPVATDSPAVTDSPVATTTENTVAKRPDVDLSFAGWELTRIAGLQVCSLTILIENRGPDIAADVVVLADVDNPGPGLSQSVGLPPMDIGVQTTRSFRTNLQGVINPQAVIFVSGSVTVGGFEELVFSDPLAGSCS